MPRLLPFLKGRGHRLEFVVGVMKVTNGRKGDAPRRECTAPRPRRGPRGGEAASKASPIQCRSIRSCRLYQAVPETRRAGVEGHARVDFRGTGPWMGRVGAKADVEEEPSKEERHSVRRALRGRMCAPRGARPSGEPVLVGSYTQSLPIPDQRCAFVEI